MNSEVLDFSCFALEAATDIAEASRTTTYKGKQPNPFAKVWDKIKKIFTAIINFLKKVILMLRGLLFPKTKPAVYINDKMNEYYTQLSPSSHKTADTIKVTDIPGLTVSSPNAKSNQSSVVSEEDVKRGGDILKNCLTAIADAYIAGFTKVAAKIDNVLNQNHESMKAFFDLGLTMMREGSKKQTSDYEYERVFNGWADKAEKATPLVAQCKADAQDAIRTYNTEVYQAAMSAARGKLIKNVDGLPEKVVTTLRTFINAGVSDLLPIARAGVPKIKSVVDRLENQAQKLQDLAKTSQMAGDSYAVISILPSNLKAVCKRLGTVFHALAKACNASANEYNYLVSILRTNTLKEFAIKE